MFGSIRCPSRAAARECAANSGIACPLTLPHGATISETLSEGLELGRTAVRGCGILALRIYLVVGRTAEDGCGLLALRTFGCKLCIDAAENKPSDI